MLGVTESWVGWDAHWLILLFEMLQWICERRRWLRHLQKKLKSQSMLPQTRQSRREMVAAPVLEQPSKKQPTQRRHEGLREKRKQSITLNPFYSPPSTHTHTLTHILISTLSLLRRPASNLSRLSPTDSFTFTYILYMLPVSLDLDTCVLMTIMTPKKRGFDSRLVMKFFGNIFHY